MTKKIWTCAILLILSFLIASNFLKPSPSGDRTSPARATITLGYSNWPGWWLWEIAKEEGLFTKNGLDVRLKWFDSYSDSLVALEAGAIDANCQTLNDTIAKTESAINDEVIVLVNDNSAGNDKIIVAEDIDSIEELQGRQVALEEGVVDDFLLTLALEKHQMSRDDVEVVNLETGAAVAAFYQEKVDAVGAFPPFWLKALKREGSKELVSSLEFPGAIADVLVVTQKMIDEQPDRVRALVDTWFDILRFMKQNPERWVEIVTNFVGITREELELFGSGVKLFDLEDNQLAFSKGDEMKNLNYASQKIVEFYQKEFDVLEEKPNLDNLINSTFISLDIEN